MSIYFSADTKVPWSQEELSALKQFFKSHIKEKKMPGVAECRLSQSQFSILSQRNTNQIRAKVRYIFSKESFV